MELDEVLDAVGLGGGNPVETGTLFIDRVPLKTPKPTWLSMKSPVEGWGTGGGPVMKTRKRLRVTAVNAQSLCVRWDWGHAARHDLPKSRLTLDEHPLIWTTRDRRNSCPGSVVLILQIRDTFLMDQKPRSQQFLMTLPSTQKTP